MTAESRSMKRRQRSNKKGGGKQREDRLSSLPDDILIEIITRLPLRLSIITGTLSRRWRGLWTNVTSIHLTSDKTEHFREFLTAITEVMTQLTSPFIHSFSFELLEMNYFWSGLPFFDSMLREIGDRNVRELKITLRYDDITGRQFPSAVFQMQSLVSVEFGSTIGWKLPEQINLPNLKNLTLYFSPTNCEWLKKLTEACPSLEELSLNYEDPTYISKRCKRYNIKCSIQNLRRLFINWQSRENHKVLINAPKIEFLAVRASKSLTYCFEEKPIALREAKIEIIDVNHVVSSNADYELTSEFYEAISNVRVLSLRVFALDNVPATVCQKVTRLTLDIKMSFDTKIVLLSVLELCPVLDVLTLNFVGFGGNDGQWIIPKISHVRTLRQALKRIELQTHWYAYGRPVKPLLKLMEFVLEKVEYLEHFKVDARGCEYFETQSVESKRKMELMFCNLLYNCPMASVGCEVEFVGQYFKMSRKAGPEILSVDGQIIHRLSCLPKYSFNL